MLRWGNQLICVMSVWSVLSLWGESGMALPTPVHLPPQSIRMVPVDTFIPSHFDDNDNVQLIISGGLPNTCFKAGSATADVNLTDKKIVVQNTAYRYSGCWCAPVTSQYMHTINLGILPAGVYQVWVQDQNQKLHQQESLTVSMSRSQSPDDFLYAPVESVFVETREGATYLKIRGQFSHSCMTLKEVKVSYESAGRMIEVLPIADLKEDSGCQSRNQSYEHEVKLEASWHGSSLVYVRALNGQAVSKMIDL